jgi:succinate-semialdehyde dehydrogenase/glutarate-semialdehyde dehydrogenase
MEVADKFEPGAVIGPLIDMKAVDKVEAHITDGVKKGAKVVTGGKRAAHQHEDGAAASSSRRC